MFGCGLVRERSFRLPLRQNHRRVDSAETEAVIHDDFRTEMALRLPGRLKPEFGPRFFQIEGGWQKPSLQHQRAEYGLYRARRATRMSCEALRARHERRGHSVAEDAFHR